MADFDLISVEVAYALPHKQKIVSLLVEPGTTARQAVERSGIIEFFPDIDVANAPLGIFGESLGGKSASYVLHEGDRVEIYRPLAVDPKDARRKRAAKNA